MKRKLGRKTKPRRQMLKNLASSIIIYEKVKTTQAHAKEVRSAVEQMINLGKINDLTARRKLLAFFMHNKNTVDKIIKDIAPRFKDKKSGYLNIYKSQPRLGDNSKMATVILAKSKFLGNLENKHVNKDKAAIKNNKTK